MPVGVTLSPNTKYFFHVAGGSGSGSFSVHAGYGLAQGIDSSSLPGWSISPFKILSGSSPSSGFDSRFSVLGLPRVDPLPDVNHVPVFSGSANFSVNENNRTVGTVVASDSDSQDSVTGYSISGGVDSSRFSIADDGVLSFKSVPNYEAPSDSGKNNEYVVEVTVKGGSSGRERFASRTFTVRVVNVVESPSAPDAPGLTSLNSTSLFVSWSAPSNTGPAIIDYDVGYGLNSGGPFTDWPHSSASRRAVITGLNAGTLYYVRVRAGTAEGNSSWSRTSAFVTDSSNAVLPVNRSVLVSNINQRLGSGGWTIDGSNYVAQEFTTGNYSNGYTVSKIVVKIHTASSTRVPLVSIYSSEGGRPGVKLYEFNGSVTETGDRSFTVPAGVTLGSDTSYFVHVAGRGSGSFKVQRGYGRESAGGFDSGSFPGWSISPFKILSGSSPSLTLLLRFSVWGVPRADPLPDVNHVPSGKPVIRGVVAVGESLFADVSGVRDLNGIPGSFSYQWVRVDGGVEENISGSGATLAIYNVVSADEGKLLKVKVSFIDGSGFSEGPLASDSTGAVLDAAPIVPHGTRLSAAITLPSSFGSHVAQSIWFDGITLYVLNSNLADRRIYAYTLSNGSRDRSKEFSDVGSFIPESIWSDGETMWVSDSFYDKIYAYKMSDKSRDSGKDFNTLNATGNNNPEGIWSDGVTMWVSDLVDDKIYAYRMSDKSRDSGEDFDTLVAAGNTDPIGIWSDGVTMWVADIASNPPVSKLFAYNMSDKSRDSGKDLNLTATFPGSLTGPGLNGRTMLLGRENEVHFYAVDSVYKLPRWSEDSGKDCGGDVSTGCSVDVNGYAVGVIDPAADVDWWSLELEGGKTYAIDVKGAGDQSGNDNAGTLPNPAVVLRSSVGGNSVVVVANDNVDYGQNNNSRVVYSVALGFGGTYYVHVAKSNSFEGGTYTVFC